MPELCSIDFDDGRDCVIARISGEIDMSNVEVVGQRLASRFDSADHYVIDLSAATHLDSAAIRLFFIIGERLRTRRQALTLVVPATSPVRRVLRFTDIGTVIEISDDLDEAIERERRNVAGAGGD